MSAPSTRQLQAGRALLGWKLKHIAHHAGAPIFKVSSDEQSPDDARREGIARILARNGVRFTRNGVVLIGRTV